MILKTILLILIIINLALMSGFAFLGRKNLLLLSAIIEACLAILFALVA